jgi:threonine aldolase
MEAAVFLPSGTMCNEIAIAVHCLPGDEVICARESHVIFAESGGPAALSGVMIRGIDGMRGMMTPDEVTAAILPDSSFAPRSRLVITEQTAKLAGGAMRQTGVLTAMCPYALDNNVERLAKDHELAQTIAMKLCDLPMVSSILPVETNIVMLELADEAPDARTCAQLLREQGVHVTAVGKERLRIVTHMDSSDEGAVALVNAMTQLSFSRKLNV